jgi:hypothetical protein
VLLSTTRSKGVLLDFRCAVLLSTTVRKLLMCQA